MTPQEMVRSRYPHADALNQKPVHVSGQPAHFPEGGWVVLSAPVLGAEVLGNGSTEEEAWSVAAKQVKAQRGKPLGSFKEWLAAQAEAEAGDDSRRRLVEEWQEDVANLFARIVRWLAEEDSSRVLKVETGKVQKEEEGLGSYDVAAMRINLGSKFVEFVPLGRNVVGGIGNRGDLGFRSEGRVDMRNPWQKYMLYRIVSEGGRSWLIVDDTDYQVRTLTKENFEAALQDLFS